MAQNTPSAPRPGHPAVWPSASPPAARRPTRSTCCTRRRPPRRRDRSQHRRLADLADRHPIWCPPFPAETARCCAWLPRPETTTLDSVTFPAPGSVATYTHGGLRRHGVGRSTPAARWSTSPPTLPRRPGVQQLDGRRQHLRRPRVPSSATYTTNASAQIVTATYSTATAGAPYAWRPTGGEQRAVIQAGNYNIGGEGVAYHDEQERPTWAASTAAARASTSKPPATPAAGSTWVGPTGASGCGTPPTSPPAPTTSWSRVASRRPRHPLSFSLDGVALGTLQVPGTGGWQTWQDLT